MSRSRLALALLLVAACRSSAPTGPLSPPDPTLDRPIGLETQQPTELDQRLATLADTLEAARVEHHVMGMAVAVVKDDTVVFARGFGLADEGANAPVTPESIFSIGSSTKAFTATLVGMQAEAGALTFDDPITRHVPEFQLAIDSPNKDDQATLRDALCHRTGFTRMSLLWVSGQVPRNDLLAQASNAQPWRSYRSQFLYNNVTYAAAGEAAARSAQTTWSELLNREILGPLGMTDTTAVFEDAKSDPRRAQGYAYKTATKVYKAVPPRDISSVAPAGAIYSNVLDMSRWVRVQLADGKFEGRQVIPAQIVAETQTQQFEIAPGNAYGLGWFIDTYKGKTVIHHGGNIDGYSAMVALIPEDNVGFVALFNVGVTPLQNLSRALVFDAVLGSGEESTATDEDLTAFVGTYIANFGPFKNAKFEVTVSDGKLFVDVPGQTNYELAAAGKDGRRPFALTDTVAVSFEASDDGTVHAMRMHQGGLDMELLRQGYTPKPQIPLAELEPLVGSYQGPKDRTLRVLVQNNRLAVDIPKQMVFELNVPNDKGWRTFRVKPTIAVEFTDASTLRLHESGQSVEFKRVKTKAQAKPKAKLPTVAALQKKRGLAKTERALSKAGLLLVQGRTQLLQAGVEGTVRIVAGAGRSRVTMDLGPYGTIEDVVFGDTAWSTYPSSPVEVHEGRFYEQARAGLPLVFLLDWNDTFDEIEVTGRGVLDGRDTVELKMTRGGLQPYEVTVDAATADVVRVKYAQMLDGPGSLPVEIRYGDYRRAAGIRVPHRVEVSNEANGKTVWVVETVRPFSGDASAEFRPPPESTRVLNATQ